MMKTFRPQNSRNDSHSVVVWPAKPGAEQRRPAGDDRLEHRVQRFAADPGLDAEPSAGDERAHQRRHVRAERAVGGAGEHRERNAVLRARVRVQQDRDEHDRVAEQDREQRLRPVHAGRHQPRRQHVGRDAVRHADPQRGVVVGRPGAPRQRDRRQILVVERARLDASGVDELDAAVREVSFVLRRHVRSLRFAWRISVRSAVMSCATDRIRTRIYFPPMGDTTIPASVFDGVLQRTRAGQPARRRRAFPASCRSGNRCTSSMAARICSSPIPS